MLYSFVRFILFLLPAEFSHDFGLRSLFWLHKLNLLWLVRVPVPNCPVQVLGLNFANPVGLAAGLDKNADYLDALGALGFGFVEVGTVTPRPQDGNPRPRMFRLKDKRALINRMGFNNKGVTHMLKNLSKRRYKGIVGVNIGKNLTTPVEKAVDDYLYCLREVYAYADYVVINLSSPNTPGLRSLQFGIELKKLLRSLRQSQLALAKEQRKHVPVLLKVAPDLNSEEAVNIAQVVMEEGLEGLIVGNTTVDRSSIGGSTYAGEPGGLSGAPLTQHSTQVLGWMVQAVAGKIPVFGVGGIMSGDDAVAKKRAGAMLIQVYTGFIYGGPALLRELINSWRES